MKQENKGFEEEGEVGKGKIFEHIVYDFVTDCRNAVRLNNVMSFCNLVELFYTNLVYSNKRTDKQFHELDTQWSRVKKQAEMTDGAKPDLGMQRFSFAMKKYRILCELLKSKNLYPKPAEGEWL